MPLCGLTEGGECAEYCGDRPGLCGLFTVTWGDETDLAAILTWDHHEAKGVLWTNRRLMRSAAIDRLIRSWALHRVWSGREVEVLQERELAGLRRTLAGTAT